MFVCVVCGGEYDNTEEHPSYIEICKACAIGGRKNNLVVTKTNEDWQKIAEQNSIEIYERQPGETDTEWRVWQAYCGLYPNSKPNLRLAAESAGVCYATARNASSKWEYVVRIQGYKLFIDQECLSQRRDAVIDMNKRHIRLADKLQTKLELAVDAMDPNYLKPNEVASLTKVLMELESKAHLDRAVTEVVDWKPAANNTDGSKQGITKKSDLSEILGILGQAGVLDNKMLGVETTTTTRVLTGDDR